MVRKKSSASKAKTRRNAYRRRTIILRNSRAWRILLLVMRAVHIFSRSRRNAAIASRLPPSWGVQGEDLIPQNAIGAVYNDVSVIFPHATDTQRQFDDFVVVRQTIHNILSKVCRFDSERQRQLDLRNRGTCAVQRKSESRMTSQRNWFVEKYRHDESFRRENIEKVSTDVFDKYHNKRDYRDAVRQRVLTKYHSDNRIRTKMIQKASDRYHCSDEIRTKLIQNASEKYHSNDQERKKKIQQVLARYHSNDTIRTKMIQKALERYRRQCSSFERERRRKYNQSRRILKKYITLQANACATKCNNLYKKHLDSFRKLSKEGPDFVCIICRLTLFRNQVLPFVEGKYVKKGMISEVNEIINTDSPNISQTEKSWICKSCSIKLKRQQMPCRAVVNNLMVCEIPDELKKLNDLEKHLIALRLPFMKIVNLSSGRISNRFGQKGIKGPLHCVPADVQDTVTSLPRPVDRSLMLRLQLKRRLKYKAVWEEQLVNPNDIREALFLLVKNHPGYKDIHIGEINENYLISDKGLVDVDGEDVEMESTNFDNIGGEISIEEKNTSNEKRLERLALGDIEAYHTDEEEIEEDEKDIRAKYNIGTHSCTQPTDLNDLVVFDKDPYAVAPGEKNKLSSLLMDKSIEALAFPHLFPDGRGSFDEERTTKLTWTEYCKARLFSSEPRFASDPSYIFFLQYLGDLKHAFSGINIAFRKKLSINVRQSIDDMQMKYLMGKDMIYRYLQSVRGSPQYWQQRLKDLFGMLRQLGCPTFFITLSCADMRWKEFVDTFVRHTGEKIKDSYSFAEKAKLLRTNPVLAARMFERRLNNFMNLFIKGGVWCLGQVQDWFSRIEMQCRGSPHAHMPIWVKDAPKYYGPSTDKRTRQDIIEFCDKHISTRFPSSTEDHELHDIIREVQTHSRAHSKSCLKHHNTLCRFGFPRPVARQTFICEPFQCEKDIDKERMKKVKKILVEMNVAMNVLEKEKDLKWSDFDGLLDKYEWTYDDYEWSLRVVHRRPTIIHKREPNARWVNQYNEQMLRAWNANMDIQFILDPYACAKYLMSYTTKPEREMSLLLEATHKECREGNMAVREEMKKLTGTFFNHREVSVQEAVYRATGMPLTYSSRGFVFVPSHSNSCRLLKPRHILTRMDEDDTDIYMSNLADKYFDRPLDKEFNICLADFASKYDIVSLNRTSKKPRTAIKQLQKLPFGVKRRCGRDTIIRFPHFNRETDADNYFENLLCLYLPIRSRGEIKEPYQLFYETGEFFDPDHQVMRKVKEVVCENRKKYESHFNAAEEIESVFTDLSLHAKEDDWAQIVANEEKKRMSNDDLENEENPDFDLIRKKNDKSSLTDLKQTFVSSDTMRPLLESMNVEQQEVFYRVRDWCERRLHDSDIEPIRLFITGGAGTGKSHLLKCLHHEATKIFSRKKHLEPDENIDEIHTLITAFTGAAAVNVGGVTIHSAFGISVHHDRLHDNLSCEKLNTYRCKLGSLKLLFVDEVSLIQTTLWGAMHSRLSQIMGIHSNKAIFGNVGMIAIGDFYQCAPVASSSIYSSMLWSDHFEQVELSINERQKNGGAFPQMLNRIRQTRKKDGVTQLDREMLQKCHQRYLNKEYHREALHLFAKNIDVDNHNENMIDQICTDIRTFHEIDGKGQEIKPKKGRYGKMLHVSLRLAKDARVMITKNISVSDGLANGVTGRVVGFIEANGEVSRILIKCDSSNAGLSHRRVCSHCRHCGTICIMRENDSNERDENPMNSCKGRKQFPLRLSWAMTIHKAQGLTVDEVVVSSKDLFCSGMGYTALSRVRTIEGLFLIDLHFDKFFCDEKLEKSLSKMKLSEKQASAFRDEPQFINVLFHNIEGLSANFKALTSHHMTKKAHLICLAETWLEDDHRKILLNIDGYKLIHRTRSESFCKDHSLHSIKRGGVGIYIRHDMQGIEIDSSPSVNLEYVAVELKREEVIIISCYRTPQQSKTEFIANLKTLLRPICSTKRVLLLGDLNENSFQTHSKTIERTMQELGFINLCQNLSTTKDRTSLDCAYVNFLLQGEQHCATIAQTFYSFHEAITVSIKIDDTTVSSTTRYDCFDDIDLMDIDCPPPRSTTSQNNPQRMKIRRNEEWEESNKKKKKIDCCSYPTTCRGRLTQRELDFLSNLETILSNRSSLVREVWGNSMSEQLAHFGLRKIDVIGDGNCFFRALSCQLSGHENDYTNLRSASVAQILENVGDYAPFVHGGYRGIDDYIMKMSRNGTFVDHLSVFATGRSINQNIIVHELGKAPLIIPGSDYIDHQLHVFYDEQKLHYEVVCQHDGSRAFLSFEDLQST